MKTLLLLLVIALAPVIAKADQITAGSYRFTFNGSPVMNLNFSGVRFSVNAWANTNSSVTVPAIFSCGPCVSGQTVSLSGNVFLNWADWNSNSFVRVDGVTYPGYQGFGIGLTNSMSFLAGSVLLPATTNSSITVSSPFRLTSGSIHGQGYGVPFTYSGGNASVTYNRLGTDVLGRTTYSFSQLVYTFHPIATPEPMTIALLGSGLFALGLRLRKR